MRSVSAGPRKVSAPGTAGVGLAPHATSRTSYEIGLPADVWARRPPASTPDRAPGEKVAPAAAASSARSKCRTSPRPNGSATASGRYQNSGSGASISTLTRLSPSSRRANAASRAATPPPAISTSIAKRSLLRTGQSDDTPGEPCPLLPADCGGNVEARKDPNGRAVVTLCDDDVRRSVPHHQSRGLAQVEIRSDSDGRLAGCVSGRELIQLPEQVSVDDVAIRDHCIGGPLPRAGHDDGVDAIRRENRCNGPQAIVRTAGDDAAVHHTADRERLFWRGHGYGRARTVENEVRG